MFTIDSFINQNYKIIYRHPDSTPNDWDTFLLGEDHEDKVIRAVNGEFLKLFSDNKSILLLEGIPSLQIDTRPQYAEEALSEVYIGPHFTREHILGWDSKSYGKIDVKRFAISMGKKILEPYQYSVKQQPFLKNLQIAQKFHSVIENWYNQQNAIQSSEFIAQYSAELQEEAAEIAEEITKYIRENISDLETKIEQKQQYLKNLKDRELHLDPSNDAEFEEYMAVSDEQIEVQSEIQKLNLTVRKSVHAKFIELQERRWYLPDSIFPERTDAMIHALKNVRSVTEGSKNVFLIAGTAHLQEECGGHPEGHLKSLKKLYSYLADKKNIIMLAPKKV